MFDFFTTHNENVLFETLTYNKAKIFRGKNIIDSLPRLVILVAMFLFQKVITRLFSKSSKMKVMALLLMPMKRLMQDRDT